MLHLLGWLELIIQFLRNSLLKVIQAWFDMENPNRETLVKALHEIGQEELARKLDQKYRGS